MPCQICVGKLYDTIWASFLRAWKSCNVFQCSWHGPWEGRCLLQSCPDCSTFVDQIQFLQILDIGRLVVINWVWWRRRDIHICNKHTLTQNWKGVWRWYDEEMLECCKPLRSFQDDGMSFEDYGDLARCATVEQMDFLGFSATVLARSPQVQWLRCTAVASRWIESRAFPVNCAAGYAKFKFSRTPSPARIPS